VNRKGITLLEVLMAIFIMGIGMVSVFAIFPVAALMMGQAIEKYQINEVVNNTQSNFDTDALEFVKNKPDSIYCGGVVLNPVLSGASPQYLFLDQAAGPTRTLLGGVTVAYINDFIIGGVSVSKNQLNERYFISNFDIELDESGRAATTPPASVGRYSVSFLLEKKSPLDNPLPSRRYMLVYKGRSQTFSDFPASVVSSVTSNSVFTVQDTVLYDRCKKGDWLMVINNLGERSFHKITALNVGSEIEVEPKFFYKPGNSGPPVVSPDQPNGVYLLSDVVRVIDMGAG
jgi:prepilin-type N-terminal cleavage/methylation domain-containing protein